MRFSFNIKKIDLFGIFGSGARFNEEYPMEPGEREIEPIIRNVVSERQASLSWIFWPFELRKHKPAFQVISFLVQEPSRLPRADRLPQREGAWDLQGQTKQRR